MSSSPDLVTTAWLDDQMKSTEWKTKFCLLDCTWDLPKFGRDFIEENKACRIPGAKLFELSECRDKTSGLSNTMPSASYFEDYVKNFAITNDKHIILYDNKGKLAMFSAPRIWWLFNIFGHSKVSILDGGLPKWKKDGYKTVSGPYTEEESFKTSGSEFKSNLNMELVRDLDFMKSNLEATNPAQVLDARTNGRFRGVEPEPNPKIPSGHIPKSISIPFFTNFDQEKSIISSPEDIKSSLLAAGVDLEKPIVLTCGSGVTACNLAFTIFLATGKKYPVFDGSWFCWQLNTPNELQVRE